MSSQSFSGTRGFWITRYSTLAAMEATVSSGFAIIYRPNPRRVPLISTDSALIRTESVIISISNNTTIVLVTTTTTGKEQDSSSPPTRGHPTTRSLGRHMSHLHARRALLEHPVRILAPSIVVVTDVKEY